MSRYSHITDYLHRHAELMPDKLAVVDAQRSMTYAELWQEVQAGADFIAQKLPGQSQATIASLLPNSWQYVVSYLSIIHAGHMAMLIDVIFKPLEIEAILRQLPPRFVIADQAGARRIDSASVSVVLVDELPAKPPKEAISYPRLPADEMVASLQFTSGTTGKPKIVPYTHANHMWNIDVCSQVWEWDERDSQLVSTRLSHMLGIVMGLSGSLYHGNTTYLTDRFDAVEILELLSSGDVTMFSHSPMVYAKLLEVANPEKYDLSKVRLCISGSGPLPPAVWQRFKSVYGVEILEVYGTTETGRIASNLLDERLAGSPGRLLPGVDVRFDKHGQVMVRSGGVFPGYFNNEEANKAARAAGGFWKVGDIGEMRGGRLVLKGRVAERIRKQGYTVSPRDVEWALHKCKRVKEVVVMGVAGPQAADDKIFYFISGQITEPEIRSYCADNLPSVWRPDEVVLLDKIPRTATGKPHLAKLKTMVN